MKLKRCLPNRCKRLELPEVSRLMREPPSLCRTFGRLCRYLSATVIVIAKERSRLARSNKPLGFAVSVATLVLALVCATDAASAGGRSPDQYGAMQYGAPRSFTPSRPTVASVSRE